MDSKIHKQLEEAKGFFYLGRLNEAYGILRRYFDRLPFKPEKGHAEYIGIFARVLLELGKEYELKFYMTELERLYQKSREPAIAYPLAVVYAYLTDPKMESAKTVLEDIIRRPEAIEFHAKAKMMLADYYSRKHDLSACRSLIDSIDTIPDRTTALLVDVWKAVLCRREKKLDEAIARLRELLKNVDPEGDWYVYFSAQVIVAMTLIDQGKIDPAKEIVAEVRRLFEGKNFKSVEVQLGELERLMEEKSGIGVIRFSPAENIFTYANKTLHLKNNSPAEKLLVLLLKRRFLDKALIVKNIYDRHYEGEQDDKLIYYHVHTLRKRLRSMGLPAEVITNEGNGYRWVPDVETVGGEW